MLKAHRNRALGAGTGFSVPTGGGAYAGTGSLYFYEQIAELWTLTDQIISDVSTFLRLGDVDSGTFFTEDSLFGGPVGVYERQADGSWLQTQDLVASDGSLGDRFGSAIAVDGDCVAIGAQLDDIDGFGSGSVYLFQKQGETWVEVGKVFAEAGQLNDSFADVVALDGDIVIAGGNLYEIDEVDNVGWAVTWSVSGALCPTLSSPIRTLSLSSGGRQYLNLQVDSTHADAFYWTVGSISGTSPGFPLGALQVPIEPDDYFFATLVSSPTSPLQFNMGVVDALGRGRSRVEVAPGSDSSLIGLQLHHGTVVYDLGPFSVLEVSNPVPLTLVF